MSSMVKSIISRIEQVLTLLWLLPLPYRTRIALVDRIWTFDPNLILEGVGPHLNRAPQMSMMDYDLMPDGQVEFYHLAQLFHSSNLNHHIISATFRQAAYMFGLARNMPAHKIVEIGRYKGGTTLLLAAAMPPDGDFWSIDLAKKEARMPEYMNRSYDDMLSEQLHRLEFEHVHLLVGDSRTIEVDTGEVDLVFIDGDHTYEGVKNDFERFGRRVRVGGAVVFDDAFSTAYFKGHVDEVGRLIREICAEDEFELVQGVDRLAHLRRVR